MKIISFLLFIQIATACEQKTIIKLSIVNRSSYSLDSIIFPDQNIVWNRQIKKGEKKMFTIDVSKVKVNLEGSESIFIYYKKRKMACFWGIHTLGGFERKEEAIYVFDNGINDKDSPLLKPKDFTFYIMNNSSQSLDSVNIPEVKIYQKRSGKAFVEFLLDYNEIQKNPLVKVIQNKKEYSIKIQHDWNDWNYNKSFIYLYDNGEFLTSEEARQRLISKKEE